MAREDDKVEAMEIDGEHQQAATTAVLDGFNADYLRIYYVKLFPYGDFFKWLSYGNDLWKIYQITMMCAIAALELMSAWIAGP
ncbi:hypothetical protein E2562_031193 [Oryza meyeriana var. granulata]|uniref:Uncharacterized protein n=1 Tax=Oryza meyeriana var. granulata TaxID=110450 RepID=A0A6G1ERR2_9ORYZ|nr:hypothetical protein E2562_031193 [Oryza meyeriana var. granulata]